MQLQTNLIPIKNKLPAILLHEEALEKSKRYRKSQAEILEVIVRVEAEKLYTQFEITNLHAYCVELLKLDSQFAYDCTAIIGKARDAPELLEAIYSGQTTVSKLRKITGIVTRETAKEWIDLVLNCSSRVVEKAVAQANPKLGVRESLRYISGDALEIQFAVSENWAQLLQITKDRLSQKLKRAVSTEEALFIVMKEAHDKNDPVSKAKRARARAERAVSGAERAKAKAGRANARSECAETRSEKKPGSDKQAAENLAVTTRYEQSAGPLDLQARTSNSTAQHSADLVHRRTRYLPAAVRHGVALRDNARCAHVNINGTRYSNTRWLDQHHVIEFVNGGEHTAENLITLCSVHHWLRHAH